MAYQGIPDGPFAAQAAERHRRRFEEDAAGLDGLARYAEIERSQVPGQQARGPAAGIAMAGQAIGKVIENQRLAGEAAQRANNTAPIIQGSEVDWSRAFSSPENFGYSEDTNWSPSSWTGGATPQSTSSFNEAYDPANFKSDEGFDFAKKLDWSNTYSFGD